MSCAVTRLRCASCGTTIEGEFRVGRFGGLSREQMALLESFLRSRGNLREMERELGLSYPTVRSRVDSLVRALGLGELKFSGQVMPKVRKIVYNVDIKRVMRLKLWLGIADGWLSADGEIIYRAKDLRVGLFKQDAA